MCFTTSFLSVTWLAEQRSKAEKGKEHLFLPLHGAQPAVGCWHPPLRPDAVTVLLCWVELEEPLGGWRPRAAPSLCTSHPAPTMAQSCLAPSSLKKAWARTWGTKSPLRWPTTSLPSLLPVQPVLSSPPRARHEDATARPQGCGGRSPPLPLAPAFPHHRLGSGTLPCSLSTHPSWRRGEAAHSGELLMTAIQRKAYDSFPLNCLLSL